MVTRVMNDNPRNSEAVAKAMEDAIEDSEIGPMIATEFCLCLIAKQCGVSDRDGVATKILATQWQAEMTIGTMRISVRSWQSSMLIQSSWLSI